MRILFVGGGTAGHIDPALAVAQECQRVNPDWKIEFLGSNKGLEKTLIPQAGFRLHKINKAPLPRGISAKAFTFPFLFITALMRSFFILLRQDAVVGFGGYVAPPAYLAAKFLGKKIFIHEANAKAGFANRLGSKFATRLFTAFPLSEGAFAQAEVVGMPLKQTIIEASNATETQREDIRTEFLHSLGLDPSRPTVVIMGGSSGSTKINSVIQECKDAFVEAGFSLIHSVGAHGDVNPSPDYSPQSYFYDMGKIYLSADFIISRSGAVTTAEIDVMGIPALFIPLAIGNGEQSFNARVLVEKEMAHIIPNSELTSEKLLGQMDWISTMSQAKRSQKKSDVSNRNSLHTHASERIVLAMTKELSA